MSGPNLPILGSFGLPANRLERHTSLEIARIDAGSRIATARETARLDTVAQVTEAALLAASHVSAVEALLIERTPHAARRLQHIADAGCVGMASIVLGAGRRI